MVLIIMLYIFLIVMGILNVFAGWKMQSRTHRLNLIVGGMAMYSGFFELLRALKSANEVATSL